MKRPLKWKVACWRQGRLLLAPATCCPTLSANRSAGELLYSGEPAALRFGNSVPNEFDDKSGIEAAYFEWDERQRLDASGRFCWFTAPAAGDYWFSAADIGCGAYRYLGSTEFRPKRGVVPCDLYVEDKSFDTVRPTDSWGGVQCKVNFSKGESPAFLM